MPPTPDCFLDGITRRTVIELASAHDIDVVERVIMPEEFEKADEVFLTGTAAEVTPVGQVDEYNFQVGSVSRTLMEDYDALVRGDNAAAERGFSRLSPVPSGLQQRNPLGGTHGAEVHILELPGAVLSQSISHWTARRCAAMRRCLCDRQSGRRA